MCFRPAEMSMNTCPSCGKANKPIATVCDGCGASLEMKRADFDADQASLDAAVRPAAPAAPAAPGAPAAPMPPSAPAL